MLVSSQLLISAPKIPSGQINTSYQTKWLTKWLREDRELDWNQNRAKVKVYNMGRGQFSTENL